MKKELVILLLILFLAAFLRLYRIDGYMTFLGDEGRDVLVVKRMIVDHKFTLLGPTASVGGFFLGPIYYYFMLPFLWLFNLNPVGPAVMVALFGVATVFLIYKTGKDFFDAKTGLIAAALYSLSPVVIAYSRSSWNPNLMPFFSLLTIYVLWLAVTKKKWVFLSVVGFLLGVAIQLHYLTVFLIAAVLTYLLFFTLKEKIFKYYLLGLIGFIIGWSPFLLFELRHHFPNLQTLYRFILFGKETTFVPTKIFAVVGNIPLRLFRRLVTNNQNFLGLLLLLAALPLFLFNWTRSRGRKQSLTYSLLSIWFMVGIVLFSFYQKDVYDYYLGFLFPLPFLLTAWVISSASKKGKVGLLMALSLFIALVGVNLKGVPFRYPPNRQLEQMKTIARFVFDKAESKPFNFALVTGGNSDHAYRYFLEVWGNSPITVENSAIDPGRKTVTDQLFVICESLPCAPLGHPLWEIAGFGRAEIEGQWKISVVEIYKLGHYKGS